MTKHRVSNVLRGTFGRVAGLVQRVARHVTGFCATLCDVLPQIEIGQSVAQNLKPTQWDGTRCNTATLLFLKIIKCMYVYTYAHVYRGNIGRALLLLRPPERVRQNPVPA